MAEDADRLKVGRLIGNKGDRPRFIRPVERQRMRPWLIDHLDKNDIPGLVWQNKREKVFRISWKHAANQCFNMQKDTNLFERWAIHTGRHYDSDHKRWKANFRCALNSLPDVVENKEQGIKKGNNAFKVYRFLDEKETKPTKYDKFRRRKEPVYIERIKQDVDEDEDDIHTAREHSYAEYQTGEGGSGLPKLEQLYPSQTQSGVDLLLQADSKERLKPLVSDEGSNLREILAAATASYAVGNNAGNFDRISIEQLGQLGERSRIKLKVTENARKHNVCGYRYVYLCGWCERVFPSKVELFQHFLILHQDKLMAGEVYEPVDGAVVTEDTAEGSRDIRLQKEIEDLEKEVLGRINKPQAKEAGEVIEDGPVVDMSATNEMTSSEMYITDQALDLSIGPRRRPSLKEETALDLSVSSSRRPKLAKIAPKPAPKRKRSSLEIDYTVKFGNYGISGKPRTKRQLSLHSKKKEEEEERMKLQSEKQHSMEDLVHAEILMSLKSSTSEDADPDSAAEERERGKGKRQKPVSRKEISNLDKVIDAVAKTGGEEGMEVEEKKEIKDIKEKGSKLESRLKPFKCGLCLKKFEDSESLGNHVHAHKSPYKCGKCELKFTTKVELISHMMTHSLVTMQPLYCCGICMSGFRNFRALQVHLQGHPVTNVTYIKTPTGFFAKELPNLEADGGKKKIVKIIDKTSDEETNKNLGDQTDGIKETDELKEPAEVTIKIEKTAECMDNENKECKVSEAGLKKETPETEEGQSDGSIELENNSIKVVGSKMTEDAESMAFYKDKTKIMNVVDQLLDKKRAEGKVSEISDDLLVFKGDEWKVKTASGLSKVVSDGANKETGKKAVIVEVNRSELMELIEASEKNIAEKDPKGLEISQKSVTLVANSADVLENVTERGENDSGQNKKNREVAEDTTKNLPAFAEIELTEKDEVSEKKSSVGDGTFSPGKGDKMGIGKKKKQVVRCGICSKTLDFEDIQGHLDAHESGKMKNKFVCQICNEVIAEKRYAEHLQMHSLPELNVLRNIICETEKPSKEEIDCEEEQVKMFVCNLCNQAFISCTHLAEHVEKHLQPRQPNSPTTENMEVKKKLKRKLKSGQEDVVLAKKKVVKQPVPVLITDTDGKKNSLLAAALNSAPKYVTNVTKTQVTSKIRLESSSSSLNVSSSASGGKVASATVVRSGTRTTISKDTIHNKTAKPGHKETQETVTESTPKQGSVSVTKEQSLSLNIPLVLRNAGGDGMTKTQAIPLMLLRQDSKDQKLVQAAMDGSQLVKIIMPSVSLEGTTVSSLVASSASCPGSDLVTSSGDAGALSDKTGNVISGEGDSKEMQTESAEVARSSASQFSPVITSVIGNAQKLTFIPPDVLSQSEAQLKQSMEKTTATKTSLTTATGQNVDGNQVTPVSVATNVSVKIGQTQGATASLGQNTAQIILVNQQAPQALLEPTQASVSLSPGQLGQLRLLTQGSSVAPAHQQLLLIKSGDQKSPLQKGVPLQLGNKTSVEGNSSSQQKLAFVATSQAGLGTVLPINLQPTSQTRHLTVADLQSNPTVMSQPLLKMLNSQIEAALQSGTKLANTSSGSQVVQPSSLTDTKISAAAPQIQQDLMTMLSKLIQPQPQTSAWSVASPAVTTVSSATHKPTFNLVFTPSSVPSQLAPCISSTGSTSAVLQGPTIGVSQNSAVTSSSPFCLSLICKLCNQKLESLETMASHVCEQSSQGSSQESVTCNQGEGKEKKFAGKLVNAEKRVKENKVKLYPCDKCSATFKDVNHYQEHLASHTEKSDHEEGLFSCRLCNLVYADEKSLSEHTESKHSAKAQKCDYCKKVFYSSGSRLEYHMIFDHPLECRLCQYRCKGEIDMRTHVLNHPNIEKSDSINLQCEKCLVGFVSLKAFLNHMRLHHPEDSFASNLKEKSFENFHMHKCTVCPCAFRSKELLFSHIEREHYRKLEYKCGLCPDQPMHYYKTKSHLASHMLFHRYRMNLPSDNQIYFCHKCLLVFPSNVSYTAHTCPTTADDGSDKGLKNNPKSSAGKQETTLKHESKEVLTSTKAVNDEKIEKLPVKQVQMTKFQCSECGIDTFRSLYQLKQHKVMRHMAPRSRTATSYYQHVVDNLRRLKMFECIICCKRFDVQSSLQLHMRLHCKPKRFSCPNKGCRWKFQTKGAVRLHQIHCKGKEEQISEARSKVCPRLQDGRQTEASSSSQTVSDVLQDFTCKLCKTNFDSIKLLKTHLFEEHSDKMNECVDCGKIFLRIKDLSQHRTECAITGVHSQGNKEVIIKKKTARRKVYGCSVCHKSFFKLMKLTKHVWEHDQLRQKPRSSKVMGETASKSPRGCKSTVKEISTAEGQTEIIGKFMCYVCKKAFLDSAELFQHVKCHLEPDQIVTMAKNKLKHATSVTGDPTKIYESVTDSSSGGKTEERSSEQGESFFGGYICTDCQQVVYFEEHQMCEAILNHTCVD